MDIAVYGGSFDPPHIGHAMVCAWLVWTRRVDEVWILPTWAHAFDKRLTPFPLRVELCGLMAQAISPEISVNEVERELPSPSYTWNTLQHLERTHPEHRFRLVVGADTLEQTGDWYRWEDIMTTYRPIVVGRGGYAPVAGSPTFPEVSSTDVRERLRTGLPFDHLVTAEVAQRLNEAWRP